MVVIDHPLFDAVRKMGVLLCDISQLYDIFAAQPVLCGI